MKTRAVEFTEAEFLIMGQLLHAVTQDPKFKEFGMSDSLEFLAILEKFIGPFEEDPATAGMPPPRLPPRR
jgi:hypothetical protein